MGSLGASGADPSDLRALTDRLRDADVVHVQNVMNPDVLAAAVATGKAVVTVQDHRVFCPGPGRTLPDGSRCATAMSDAVCQTCLPDRTYRTQMLERTAARRDAIRGARIVVLSRYMADELADAGLPGATVIPPPVRAAPSPAGPGAGFLLAGRLVHHKGVDWGLVAWRTADTEHGLSIAGAGAMADSIEGATMLGWLDRDALRAHMAAARALLFPSRWQEPFGIAGVEALAEGTPVVCMDAGGTRDWSDAGCIVVAPGDVAGMAEALAHLDQAPAAAAALGRRGWDMVRERFDPDRVHAALRSVYASVA